MRRTVLVAIMTAVLALAGTEAALAAVPSTIKVGYNHQTELFHGRIDSSNAECAAGRVVRIFKKTAAGRTLQGMGRSDTSGVWRVEVMHAHGHYVAVAQKAKAMHATCAKATSRTIDVM